MSTEEKGRKQGKGLSRRDFLRMSVLTGSGAVVASCAPEIVEVEKEVPVEVTRIVEIEPEVDNGLSLWSWGTAMARYRDFDGNDVFVDRLAVDTGLELELSTLDGPDMVAKLKASLPAGTGPDVYNTDFSYVAPFWGFTEPLNAWGGAEWGANWKTDIFSDSATSEMELVASSFGELPGEALYLPGNMQLLGWIYYWIPKFEELGVDASGLNTWEDFETLCNTIKAAGVVPMGNGGEGAHLVDWYKSLVEVTAPGKFEEAQRGTGSFTDPGLVKAFDLFSQVYNEFSQEGAIGAMDNNAIREPFYGGAGEVPMYNLFTGTPYFGWLTHDRDDIRHALNNTVGTFMVPGAKGLAATDAGVAMVASGSRKANAWKYMKWRTIGSGGQQIAGTGQPMGARALRPKKVGTDFDTNLQAPLLDALANQENVFRRVLCPDVNNTLMKVLPGVVVGEITSAQAADEVQAAFDANCGQWT